MGIPDFLDLVFAVLLFARWFGLIGYNAVSARVIGVSVNNLRRDSPTVVSESISLSVVLSLAILGTSACCVARKLSAPALQMSDMPRFPDAFVMWSWLQSELEADSLAEGEVSAP